MCAFSQNFAFAIVQPIVVISFGVEIGANQYVGVQDNKVHLGILERCVESVVSVG